MTLSHQKGDLKSISTPPEVSQFGNYRAASFKTHPKVEHILKGSLDLIPSPSNSVKIQIMNGKGKTLLGVVNKVLKTKSLLTSASNVLPQGKVYGK